MSLEAALQANTEAMNAHTAAMTALIAAMAAGGVISTPAAVTAPATGGKGKGKKADANTADAKSEVTTYFYSEKHDSVYSRKPGDPEVNMEGAVEITAEQFKEHSDRLKAAYKAAEDAKKGSDAANAGGEDPFADPFAAAAPEPLTQKQVIDKLMEVNTAKGREKVFEIVKKVGATSVPTIPAEKFQEAHDLAVAALK